MNLDYLRNMKFRFLLYFCLYLFSLPLSSQFVTDFSEGNLDVWEGDKASFIINASEQLQLNAPEGSTHAWLYTPVTFSDSMVWDMYINLQFAPSTSNQLKIFLAVNSFDLDTASGYYLEIGASGDQDPLELKYLNNGTGEALAASTPGLVGMDPVEINIRVVRKENGEWQVYRTDDIQAELLFTTTHGAISLSALSYFGFDCRYTSTRRDKFVFDDISILPPVPDTIAPKCLSLDVPDANSVELTFDEILDEATATSPANYSLMPGGLPPDGIQLNQPKVTLTWNTDFVSQQAYTLSISGIMDPAGNTLAPTQKMFSYTAVESAQPNEILITEIMADPTPAIGLPAEEYLELYNASSRVFNLADYTIQAGASERALPDMLLPGNSYVILCDEDLVSSYETYGSAAGVDGLPGLSNSGSSVVLKDGFGQVIHQVDYALSWYGDASKSDGGWSLEMKNPTHICSDADNWRASNDLSGGTPGKVNSVWETTPDMAGPELVSIYISSPTSLLLRFNEKLDPILMENPSAYPGSPNLTVVSALLSDAKTIELGFAAPLDEGVTYYLLPFDAFDCLGNVMTHPDTVRFGLTAAIEPGDLLVNEILFNPGTGGSRFVEVINVSNKFIDLSTLAIGRISPSKNDVYATGVNEILDPGQLAVFTTDPADIESRYTVPHPERMFTSPLPSWGDKTDNVSLIAGGQIIDSFTYQSAWHLPVIADQNGVSLERVATNSPSTLSSTWHSASSASGNATPTGVNSQQVSGEISEEMPYSITNSVFSPDDDGFNDFLALNFLLETGDFIGSVWVYDLEGREIIQLLSNESLGSSTLVQWDGRNADQHLADMGIYILFIQLWDEFGNLKNYKETCALVKR